MRATVVIVIFLVEEIRAPLADFFLADTKIVFEFVEAFSQTIDSLPNVTHFAPLVLMIMLAICIV